MRARDHDLGEALDSCWADWGRFPADAELPVREDVLLRTATAAGRISLAQFAGSSAGAALHVPG
jgi:hypothetical protein